MPNNDALKLAALAKNEAQTWVDSTYYEDAEPWTPIFWNPGSVFFKIFSKLNRKNLVELACGHGRHSEQVLTNFSAGVESFVGLDILESNIEACLNRLDKHPNATFIKNNGISFEPLEKSSVSGIFCYDAMVHFDKDVVQAYLSDAERVLTRGGMAVFHHSNYDRDSTSVYSQNPHARAYMSASLFKRSAEKAGFVVVEQILTNWGNVADLDCITLVRK